MNPRQLAAKVNGYLKQCGLGDRRIDPTAPYSWVRHGYQPYDPIPSVVATVLSAQLGHTVRVDELWPQGRRSTSTPVVDLRPHGSVEEALHALSELTTLSTARHADIAAVSGPDLAAAVLDGLHTTMSWTRPAAGRERVLPPQVELIGAHV